MKREESYSKLNSFRMEQQSEKLKLTLFYSQLEETQIQKFSTTLKDSNLQDQTKYLVIQMNLKRHLFKDSMQLVI